MKNANESKFRQLIVSFENKMKDLTQDGFKSLKWFYFVSFLMYRFASNKWTFSIPNFEFFCCYKIQPQRLTFQFVFYWGLLNWSRFSYWTKYLSLLFIFRVMNLLYQMISVFLNKFKEHFTRNYVVLFDFRSSDPFP